MSLSVQELLDRPFATLPELIHAHASAQPDHAALIQEERQIGYAALDALMDRVAASLQRDTELIRQGRPVGPGSLGGGAGIGVEPEEIGRSRTDIG